MRVKRTAKSKSTSILRDLYDRIVRSWRSTATAVLIIIGLVEWQRQDITTDQFIAYIGAIATVVTLLHKEYTADQEANDEQD